MHSSINQCTMLWAVREITKISSTFSPTNISSDIVWLIQLHDTIQMKSNYTWIICDYDNIALRSHIMIYNCVWNLTFGTKSSSIYLAKGEKRLGFRLSFVNLQRAKAGTHTFDAKYRYALYKSYLIARLVTHLIDNFSKWMFTVWKWNALKFGSKMKF